jgi:hypothetical protein
MVVAHVSQLQAAGSCLVHDAVGSGANEFLTYGIEEAPI